MNFGSVVDAMAELFVRELTEAWRDGHPAGHHQGRHRPRTLTAYEKAVFEGAPPRRRSRRARRSRRTPTRGSTATISRRS
jgi:hypothetical protein